MKSVRVWILALLFLPAWVSLAEGQYRPPPRQETKPQEEDAFGEAVDLDRFRKGNMKWNTQELIASGLTALHREHQQILKELKELRYEIQKLKEGKE